MDIVALVTLNGPVEVEAPLFAEHLGCTAYEAGLLLRTPSPVVLFRTEDRARAMAVLAGLRARGHDAVACDAAAVVSSDAMFHVRTFVLDGAALTVTNATATPDRCPWGDVVAIVRAVHRTRSEHVQTSTSRKLDLGRAAISGGLLVTKKVTTSTSQVLVEREPVLYLFRSAGAPLLFQQSRTRYDALGRDLKPSQIENFATVVRLLREHAPRAPYDERLLTRPATERVRADGGGVTSASSTDGVDLLAHLVALAISRPSAYRTPAGPDA